MERCSDPGWQVFCSLGGQFPFCVSADPIGVLWFLIDNEHLPKLLSYNQLDQELLELLQCVCETQGGRGGASPLIQGVYI